jgi:hypothetical protein
VAYPYQEKPGAGPYPKDVIYEITTLDLSPEGGDENKRKDQQH